MRQRRSLVRVSGLVPRRGRPVLWAYGYADLAVLLKMSDVAVRKAVERGAFDPASLASIVAFATGEKLKR